MAELTQDPLSGATDPDNARKPRGYRPGRAGTVVAAAILLLIFLWTLAPGVFAPGDPLATRVSGRLLSPGPGHLFGTDELGRDVYTRVVHGAAMSMTAAAIAVAVATVAGALLGALAGYLGGWVDTAIMRLTDVALAIPGTLLALLVVAALGFGTINVAVAVGVASTGGLVRIMRTEVRKTKTAEFVEAAKASGARGASILTRHIIPHAVGPLVALIVPEFGGAILAVSTLSFLGFGAAPPTPEWGAMVADGVPYLATSGWLSLIPTILITAVVMSIHRISGTITGPRAPGSRI